MPNTNNGAFMSDKDLVHKRVIESMTRVIPDVEALPATKLLEIYDRSVEAIAGSKMISEEHDIELKPHPNGKGTSFIVHKISKASGIKADQLKVGESISDSNLDDLKDVGYSVKIHSK